MEEKGKKGLGDSLSHTRICVYKERAHARAYVFFIFICIYQKKIVILQRKIETNAYDVLF